MTQSTPQPSAAPSISRMERKARITDEAFRAIVATEQAERDRKTARLKALREQMEAAQDNAAPKAKPRKKR